MNLWCESQKNGLKSMFCYNSVCDDMKNHRLHKTLEIIYSNCSGDELRHRGDQWRLHLHARMENHSPHLILAFLPKISFSLKMIHDLSMYCFLIWRRSRLVMNFFKIYNSFSILSIWSLCATKCTVGHFNSICS